MNLTPRTLLAHARTEGGRRAIRYSATSLICIAISQVFFLAFYRLAKWEEIPSNLSATMITSVPAFMLNKSWVWGKKGKAHLRREVLPFWMFTVAGWVLSTGMVALVQHVGEPHSTFRTGAVMTASLGGFGILWVLKYMFLDKIMFGGDNHTPYDEEMEAEEAVLDAMPTASSAET
ncbi:MAG: GtrA family protein [Aquihabitans sp.]